jgi:hypothetical protein
MPEDEEMGLLTCLTLCWELWTWLAGDMGREKQDWPRWEELSSTYPGITVPSAHCPCCYYAKHVYMCSKTELGDTFCSLCPLLPLWPQAGGNNWYPCLNQDNPYCIWREDKQSSDYRRRKAANQIADYCQNEIARISGGEK